MPDVIASFIRSGHRTTFHVVRGDAMSIDADVAVIGRAPEVRRRLVEQGADFQPLSENATRAVTRQMHGRVLQATVPEGCWRQVFAVNYGAGHNNRLELRSPWGAIGTHPAKLAFNLSGILSGHAATGANPLRFLLLPLSWRNPTVVCAAAVAASYGFASLWDRHEPPMGWQFLLCDQHDPSPFLRFLRNEEDCFGKFIGQTMLMSRTHYHEHPLREIPAAQSCLFQNFE